MSKDKAPKIMDLVSYGKFKTICNCNGGPYEYINAINYEGAQKAYDALEAKLAECVAALEEIYRIDNKIHSDGSIEMWGCGTIAREVLAKVKK